MSAIASPTPFAIAAAGRVLGSFLIKHAHHIGRTLGFSYEPSEHAPNTLEEVKAEYSECLRRRRAFRVWSGGSDCTVYGSPEANYAFRFWHDVLHAQHGTAFDLEGEWRTADIHLETLRRRFGADSLEVLVFTADTRAQSYYAHLTNGGFVVDQRGFVEHVVQGMARGEPMEALVAAWVALLAS